MSSDPLLSERHSNTILSKLLELKKLVSMLPNLAKSDETCNNMKHHILFTMAQISLCVDLDAVQSLGGIQTI